jgi:hypothetical protein
MFAMAVVPASLAALGYLSFRLKRGLEPPHAAKEN